MGRNKLRRLHVPIDPPVTVEIDDRRVTFVGLNLLNRVVMVEYDIEPPLDARTPFGSRFLVLDVTDDLSDELYPTAWENFEWRDPELPGRTTTRLDRRPPATARRLHVWVRAGDAADPQAPGPGSAELRTVTRFDVELPPEHGLPWRPTHDR